MQAFLHCDPSRIEDVGHDMSRRNKVDVVAAHLLETYHHVRHIFIFYLFSPSLMRDGPVLAENTAKVAVRKEDRARPILPHQWHLLAKVRMKTEDDWFEWSPAESPLTLLPIHSAPPGTELAVLEDGAGLLDPPGQLTFFF